MSFIMKCQLKGKEASDAIGVIGKELHKFSDSALSSFVKEVVEMVEEFQEHDGAIFEIVARCLSRLGSQEGSLDYEGESVTRTEFKALIINKLVDSEWSHSFCVNLLSTFRELGLSEEEQKKLAEKGVEMLDRMQEEVPMLVYQLLLFSPRDKGALVVKITSFFERKEKEVRGKKRKEQMETLWQSEGRVLLHVDMALKQDPSLAGAFLKTLQKESFTISSFMLAFLLSLSNSARHQEAVMKLLMIAVQAWVQDELMNNSHAWATPARKEVRLTEPLDIVLRETITRAKHGWHAIIQPLIGLAFSFLDTKAKLKNTTERLRELASDMLLHIFKVHEGFQGDVLNHVLSRISTTSAEASAYIRVLSLLVKDHSHQIIAHEAHLKEAFDYLTYLKPSIGLQLVEAVIPLLSFSKSFQDHLMIVFRKTMFRGDLTSRLTAVGGFARWITEAKEMDESLSHEILGFLNRGLTQQMEVRSVVYSSLQAILPERSEDSLKQIFEMLQEQLERYFPEQGRESLNLELCLDGDCIVEPIGTLLAVAVRCVSYFEEESHPLPSSCNRKFDGVKEKVKAFAKSVEESDMEDFGLDKNSDFSDTRNLALASLLSSLYVACIECVISGNVLDSEQAKRVIRLFKKHAELTMAMQRGAPEVGEGAKKRKKSAAPHHVKQGPVLVQHLGLEAIKNLFFVLAKPNQDKVSQMIRDEREFHLWIITHLSHVLQALFDADITSNVSRKQKLQFCDSIGPSVMCEYKRDCGSLNTVVAEILSSVIDFVAEQAHGNVEGVVTFLEIANPLPGLDSANPQASLLLQLRTFFNFVPPLLMAKNHKEMLLILNFCDSLIKLLKQDNVSSLVKIVRELLCQHSIENVVAVKALVTLYLDISEKNSSLGSAALLLAEQINCKMGKMNEEVVHEEQCQFVVITEKSWNSVALLCLGVCEKYLEEIEWASAILKGNESSVDFAMEKLRTLLYQRIDECLAILNELSKTNARWTTATEQLIKCCTKLFKDLVNLTKTSASQKHVPSQGFANNIKHTGELIRDLYDLIENVKDNEPEVESKKQKIQAIARTKREGKILPALVFEIERLEASVLKYQAQCRITLMSDWRRSAERDFKIDQRKMAEILKRRVEEGEEEEQEEQQQGEKKGRSATKKKQKNAPKEKEEEDEEEEDKEQEEQEDGAEEGKKTATKKRGRKKAGDVPKKPAMQVKKSRSVVTAKRKSKD